MNTLLSYYMRTSPEIDHKLLWRDEALSQMLFMRDTVNVMLRTPVFVVGDHTSKSINLPVYWLILRNGIKVIISCNFYVWVISVELPKSLPDNYLPKELFIDGVEYMVRYCYGFKDEWKYGCYSPGALKFTVELANEYTVYTMLFLLEQVFPERSLEDNQRDVFKSIEEIYRANGFSKEMEGWEILCGTFVKFEDCMIDSDDPKKFAEEICKRPDVLSEFLLEENAFNTKF